MVRPAVLEAIEDGAVPFAAPSVSLAYSSAGVVLQVLAGVDLLDGAAEVLGGAAEQGPDVDDALALLPRDPRPVVRVGGVGQVLVLLELVGDRVEQVV